MSGFRPIDSWSVRKLSNARKEKSPIGKQAHENDETFWSKVASSSGYSRAEGNEVSSPHHYSSHIGHISKLTPIVRCESLPSKIRKTSLRSRVTRNASEADMCVEDLSGLVLDTTASTAEDNATNKYSVVTLNKTSGNIEKPVKTNILQTKDETAFLPPTPTKICEICPKTEDSLPSYDKLSLQDNTDSDDSSELEIFTQSPTRFTEQNSENNNADLWQCDEEHKEEFALEGAGYLLQSREQVEYICIKDSDVNTSSTSSLQHSLFKQNRCKGVLSPITCQTAMDLRVLLWGNFTSQIPEAWKYQSLSPRTARAAAHEISLQNVCPGGLVAVIQSQIIIDELFADKTGSVRRSQEKHLASAISKILWRCRPSESSPVFIVLPINTVLFTTTFSEYVPDHLTERLLLCSCLNFADVESCLLQNMPLFMSPGNPGALLCLYSAVLTRTINGLRNDMSETDLRLLERGSYCSQEVINLFLAGRATSGVHNNDPSGSSPGGVPSRSDVGFLSLKEHCNKRKFQIGSFYKTPKYPVWLAKIRYRYCLLYCTKKDLLNNWRLEQYFTLMCFDGLNSKLGEMKIVIDNYERPVYYNPLDVRTTEEVHDLEHVIKTKWPDAEIELPNNLPDF